MKQAKSTPRFLLWLFAAICAAQAWAQAAVFPGNASIQISDPDSALSWNPFANALTVSCWFKLTIPSDITVADDMAILVNRTSGSSTDLHAFAIYLRAATGQVEFSSKGLSSPTEERRTLIERPYLDRWYHIAVVRDGSSLTAYVDGRVAFSGITTVVGNSSTNNGVTIGGWGNTKYLRGEVQEVQIYNVANPDAFVAQYMFADVDPLPLANELRGYFKLRHSANPADHLKNFAAPPTEAPLAPVANGVIAGSGSVEFPETNQAGEQSTFDSKRNGGSDAVAQLSGNFSWSHSLPGRTARGLPFELKLHYNSSAAFSGSGVQGFVPFSGNGLSPGWAHSFDIRLIPSNKFEPLGSDTTTGLLMPDGSVEIWDSLDGIEFYPRHGEYRGELKRVSLGTNGVYEWITPDRQKFSFRTPLSGTEVMRGRLLSIRDFNTPANTISFNWDASNGRLLSAVDPAGGICTFSYPAGRLQSISYLGWTVNLGFDGNNRLSTKSLSAPASYSLPVIDRQNLNPTGSTQWQFTYNTQGLLEGVITPRYQGQNIYDVRVTYDAFGRKVTEVDPENRHTTFKYNVPALRQLTTTEHFSGTTSDPLNDRVMVQTFDRKLRLLSQKDPMGFTTRYEYDAAGNVTAITDPRGARTSLTYDARSNILSRTNALGETTTWQYAHLLTGGVPLNKPTKEIRPATAEAPGRWENRYTYDGAGNLLTHEDDIGTLATHAYDTRGLVTSSRDANNNETTFSYDPVTGFLQSRTTPFTPGQTVTWAFTHTELGWPKTETNPHNQTTALGYNINGQVISTTDAIGRIFTKAYDGNGNLVAESDGKGVYTTFLYNVADELVAKYERPLVGPEGFKWEFSYNRFGELEFTISPSAVSDGSNGTLASRNIHDLNGRLIEQRDPYYNPGTPALHRTLSEYDANGNLTATVDKTGKRWEKSYDALNRVFAERDPEGNVSRTSYDAVGRVLVLTTPNGFPAIHEYDGRGRLKKWKDPEGFEWEYHYDGVGNIEKIVDALDGEYLMTYGPRNERLTERNQDLQTWTYTYDELVRLKTQTNPPGSGAGPGGGPVTRTLNYDPVGRLESVEFNTGRINSLGYDDNNNVRFATRTRPGQPTTTLQLDYDAMDRLVETRDTFSKTVRYGYDALGRIVTKSYPGGKVLNHGYDKLSRLTSLAFTGVAQPCTFGYDDAGRLTSRSYPNGVTQTNTFDHAGRLSSLGYGGTASPQVALSYAYDRNGNKTGGSESGTLAWKDADLAPYDESASFTAGGKLIARADALSARDFTYAYDDAGNLKTANGANGESYALSYDEDNRTTGITWDLGTTGKQITNRYDALGRRVARTLDTTETRYVLDLAGGMERVLCDTTANGTITAWYIYGPDLCFKVANTGAITCYHPDAQGNILRTTNISGATVNQYAYTPYGRVIEPTPSVITDPSDPYRFVGSQGVMMEFSETAASPPGLPSSNLYFMRARYYSAEAAVFFATDPVKRIGPGWEPSAYGYADANPLSNDDPDGEHPALAGAGIGFAAGFIGNSVSQWWNTGSVDWSDAATEGAKGAAFGAITGATGGMNLIAAVAITSASGAGIETVGEGVKAELNGGNFSSGFTADNAIAGFERGATGAFAEKVSVLAADKFSASYLPSPIGGQLSQIRTKAVDQVSTLTKRLVKSASKTAVVETTKTAIKKALNANSNQCTPPKPATIQGSNAAPPPKPGKVQVAEAVKKSTVAIKAVGSNAVGSVRSAVNKVKSFFLSFGKKKK